MGDKSGAENKSIFTTITEGIQNSLGKNFNKENTEAEPSKKKGFFYSFSSENELEGVEKVLEVGREQINNLQKKHAGLEDKLQAEVTKCTEEQENIKKEIEKVQAEMERLSGMIETSRASAASATGASATGPSATGPSATGNTSDSSSFSESSMDNLRPDNLADNRPDNLADNRPDNLADNRPDNRPDNLADNNLAEADKPNKNELEAVLPGVGGTRRRKKRRTKRRRRRGCSRKRSKWTRGRGR